MLKSGGFLVALVFIGLSALSVFPAIAKQPPASIIVDANSGAVLHSDAADATRFPASLTKMMTIYLIFERLDQGRLQTSSSIMFSGNAADQPPSKLGLAAGATITAEQALKALITKSANDVATAVAEHIAGSEPAFARLMTAKARALGMSRTVFRNASGLPDDAQVTTARDMATLGLALQDEFPARYRMFSLQRFYYGGRRYTNHNRLLGRFRGVDGIKTGYTRASGFNITTNVRRNGRHLVGVVIGQRSGRARDVLMRNLLETALQQATTDRTRRRRYRPQLIARPQLVSGWLPARVERPVATNRHRPPQPMTLSAAASDRARATVDRPAASWQRPTTDARLPSTLGAQRAAMSGDISSRRAQPYQRPSIHQATAQQAPPSATHQIQIGAYVTEADAQRALAHVQHRAGQILRGYRPLFVKIEANQRQFIRVRFAGFDQSQADATCSQLKTVRVDCFVARNN